MKKRLQLPPTGGIQSLHHYTTNSRYVNFAHAVQLDSLRDENKMLREKLAGRKKMERIGGACYILEDGGAKTGPICPQCYAEDGIVMLLESDSHGASCPRCGTRYAGVASGIEGPSSMISY